MKWVDFVKNNRDPLLWILAAVVGCLAIWTDIEFGGCILDPAVCLASEPPQ
jgi:hypothetical protein